MNTTKVTGVSKTHEPVLTPEVQRQMRATFQKNTMLQLLSPADIDALIAVATQTTRAAGEKVFGQGANASSIFVVVSGAATVTTNGQFTAKVDAGKLLGIHALTGEGTRQATITADEQMVLVEVALPHLKRMLQTHPTFAAKVNEVQRERAAQINDAKSAQLPALTIDVIADRQEQMAMRHGAESRDNGAPVVNVGRPVLSDSQWALRYGVSKN